MNQTQPMDAVVRQHLQNTLERFHWNKSRAAIALELDRRTVLRMVDRFKLKPLAPELDPGAVLRCDECGSVSEPGETDAAVQHTHTCPLGAQ